MVESTKLKLEKH